jgi:hypothetical protein
MRTLFTVIAAILTLCSIAQNNYSRIKIYVSQDAGMQQLAAAGIAVDHGEYRRGCCFTTDLSQQEIQKISTLGFNYDVVIPDVKAYYTNTQLVAPPLAPLNVCGPTSTIPVPTNFALGSMGGFFTLSEIYWHLDNMATLYPNLVKPRVAIDSNNTTHEGRYIYWLKISDNPNVDENEPEGLYTAAHHAREPAGVSQLIMYMYYLLENYNSNPEVQYIVNNTELYFVPCINPDGYEYNYSTDPQGGGMWRKNRYDNQDGSYGIDLNRNYSNNWGYDNNGSSPNTFDDTYRGVSPASEPETQNIISFCNTHNFRIALNFHTYSNLLICPWGYAPATFTPDAAIFNAWGSILTEDNKYQFGTADQTVGYVVNGSSDDWMYGEQTTKPKIFAMTPEAGDQADGFWPLQSRIVDICMLNIPMDLNMARLLLAYGKAKDTEPRFIATSNGHFNFEFQRLGLDSPAVYTVWVQPLTANITSVGSPRVYANLNLLQTVNDSISFTINSSTPVGSLVQYILTVSNGLFTWNDTITKTYGGTSVLLANTGNSITGWTASGPWNTTNNTFYSAPSSIADSPFGNYSNNANTSLRTTNTINLNGVVAAQLSYRAKWDLEAGYDYSQVAASIDNGATWIPLCGKFTTNNNNLDGGNPTYTGVNPNWVAEEISLDAFIGQQIMLRFRLESDGWVSGDGFFFDDLKVEVIDTTTSGIAENGAVQISAPFPNPADEYVWINTGDRPNGTTLEVMDQFGRVIYTQGLAAGNAAIQVNTVTWSSGIYYYRVISAQGSSSSRKLIKQ